MDTGLAALAIVAQLRQKAVDLDQLSREHVSAAEPADSQVIVRAARSLGFQARSLRLSLDRLNPAITPLIFQDF